MTYVQIQAFNTTKFLQLLQLQNDAITLKKA